MFKFKSFTTVFANISQFSALHLFFSVLLEGECVWGGCGSS